MIGYAFSSEKTTEFYKPIYPSFLEALNWATGPFLYRIETQGEITKEKDGVFSDSMVVLGRVDSSTILKHFARRCAFRSLARTKKDVQIRGAWRWLRDDVKPRTWDEMMIWARDTEMLWMNGGHVEASICNALLCHCKDRRVEYHAWKAAKYAQILLGKFKELPTQEKSLKQSLNRELAFVA